MVSIHAALTCLLDVLFITGKYYGYEEEDKWNTLHLISMGIMIFAGLMGLCVGCLSGYHGKLAIEGVTTNEEIRGKFSNGSINPYDNGCMKNCSAFWFGGTSRIYGQDEYDVEELS